MSTVLHCPQCGGTRIADYSRVTIRNEVLAWNDEGEPEDFGPSKLMDDEESCDPPLGCMNWECPWVGHAQALVTEWPAPPAVSTP